METLLEGTDRLKNAKQKAGEFFEEVLRRAEHMTASASLTEQQLTILGRVLRAPLETHLHQASLIPGTLQPATSRYVRRVGRPRKEWVPEVLQEAYRRNTTSQSLYELANDANSTPSNCPMPLHAAPDATLASPRA